MYYIVETDKSFEQAATDLDAAVKRHTFGVLHIHDLGTTLRSKGIDFTDQCKVFEVCSPKQAAKVLDIDMQLNMALPCRISVWHKDGQTRNGMIKSVQMLGMLAQDSALTAVAREVEGETMRKIRIGYTDPCSRNMYSRHLASNDCDVVKRTTEPTIRNCLAIASGLAELPGGI
ncbi:MAG: DUF302 domain-containing protein [Dokdonella sp.]